MIQYQKLRTIKPATKHDHRAAKNCQRTPWTSLDHVTTNRTTTKPLEGNLQRRRLLQGPYSLHSSAKLCRSTDQLLKHIRLRPSKRYSNLVIYPHQTAIQQTTIMYHHVSLGLHTCIFCQTCFKVDPKTAKYRYESCS